MTPISPKVEILTNSETNSIQDLGNQTEKGILNKYNFKDSKHNKGQEMIYNCFKSNIKNYDIEKAIKISYKIIECILQESTEAFPKVIRTKCHNLKENGKLCAQVYEGQISPMDFAQMSISDMQSEDLKLKDEVYIKESLLSSQVAKLTADTNMFTCGKCKENKCAFYQLQTRSCDEPMTTFVTCTVCGNKWKF